MNDNITIHFQPTDQRDGKTVKGTAGNSSLDVFASTFIAEASQALSDFQIPTRIIISNSTQYSRSLEKALENSSSIHLRFRIARKSGPMEFPTRPILTTSSFDQTLLGAYLTRHLEHWCVNPWLYQSESLTDYHALKCCCIPITLSLGAYYNLSDLALIEKDYTRISHAVTRALVNYLWPFYYGGDQSPVQRQAEQLFCNESQGSPTAYQEEAI